MKYLCCILGLAMLFLTPVITYTCRISQFVCRNNKCVSPDKYCDGVDDCGDMSDEPRFCTVCNRTYYGDVRSTYYITLQKPVERKLPFLCHLTFTANGHEFGDIVQLGFENFHVGRLETQTAEGCPDGYMQILELGRPFTGGSWCGKSNGLALYFSESSTVTLTIRLFYTGRFAGTPFEFRLRYKFVNREEASARFGSAAAPIERGEIIPGTYCSRNFYECYRKKCQVQSPNYPGLYPRNVTCLYQIRQKTVPKCKHGMILVQQTNRHKMRLKRSAAAAPVAGSSASAASAGEDGELGNRTESALRVWDSCDGHRDRIIFYDGLTTEDAVLFVFCGGEWLPPVLSRGPQMLVAFYSSANNVPLQTKESFSLLKGFELDADTVFTDSDSYDFSRHRTSCDFLVNATESETEAGVAVKSKNRSGSISSPRHTLPPNTTCTYRFQGRADDHVWLSIASYWHEALRSGAASDSCPTRLRIWDGGGQMLGDHCSRPKICDHSALRNHSRWTRPCGADESYVSPSNSAIMQYFSRPGTAVHPSRFLVHYEFVDTSLGGRAWAGGDRDDRAQFGACSRLFRGAQGGAVRSPRNVFMFARGGATRLACLYRIEADAGERISLTLYNVSFGSANAGAAPGCRSAVDAYIGDQYTCALGAAESNATGGAGGRQSRLEIAELPWRDVKVQRSCFCDNATLALAGGGAGAYVFESVARVVELRFHVYFANAGDDFHDVYFQARFRMLRKADCPRRQRVRGSGGEIQMTFPAHKRTDSLCEGLPWMVEARENHSLFVLTWGHILPLKPVGDEQIRCHTRNRILLYSGSPLRLFHVICPGTPNDSQQEIHIFSEEWHTRARGDRAMPNKPPSFLLRFVGKEPGSALLNWMEISRARTPLHLRLEPALNLTLLPASPSAASPASTAASNRSISPTIHFDCPFHCPELKACIDSSLWCDGHRNCPSGYDELESHCDLKYKVMRNYFILSTIMAVIMILTVFVLVAIFRRCFQYGDGGHYADEATGPRRITTEETLYDQSSSTISS